MKQNKFSKDLTYILRYYGIMNRLFIHKDDPEHEVSIVGWNKVHNYCAFNPLFPNFYINSNNEDFLKQFYDLLEGSDYKHSGYKLKWKKDLKRI